MAQDFSFSIQKNVGVLGTTAKGWTTELNLVSWNNRPAKYDIRSWDAEHKLMSKGITLSKEELLKLATIIQEKKESL